MRILIKDVNLLSMSEDTPNISKKDILIENNRIINIDTNINDISDKIVYGSGKVAMPGFVNTHTHIAMSLFRGYRDELKLMDWLYKAIFPVEERLTTEDVAQGAELSCVEMIKNGTTTFCDMYFYQEETIKTVEKMGLRALIAWNMVDNIKNKDDVIEKIRNACYAQRVKNSRVQIAISAHSLYTCGPEFVKELIDLSASLNCPFHIHLSETLDEINIVKSRYNTTPVELLLKLGIEKVHSILAHGIYINEDEIEILKGIDCGVSHNPVSNCKLASGICDVTKLRKSGINVGIGTDGQGSTTTLDMFEEMKVCGYLQKVKYSDPTIIKAYDILKMATIDGAKLLGLNHEIGTIEIGKKADIILIDINKPHLTPENDIVTNLVYSANSSDVDTVIVDGKLLMQNRILVEIDEAEILKNTRNMAKKVL